GGGAGRRRGGRRVAPARQRRGPAGTGAGVGAMVTGGAGGGGRAGGAARRPPGGTPGRAGDRRLNWGTPARGQFRPVRRVRRGWSPTAGPRDVPARPPGAPGPGRPGSSASPRPVPATR